MGGARVGALVLDPVVDVLGAHVELAVARSRGVVVVLEVVDADGGNAARPVRVLGPNSIEMFSN